MLGHVLPGVEAVYDRHGYLNEKRDLLEAWARHIERVIGEPGNVVQIVTSA